jgi:hypothetical protein
MLHMSSGYEPLLSHSSPSCSEKIIRMMMMITTTRHNICLLIDTAIPLDSNVILKEAEKKLKYKNLSIELQQIWNMKCFVSYQ